MFFENFPIIAYDSVGNGEYKAVTDLLRRVAIRSKVRSNVINHEWRLAITPLEVESNKT